MLFDVIVNIDNIKTETLQIYASNSCMATRKALDSIFYGFRIHDNSPVKIFIDVKESAECTTKE